MNSGKFDRLVTIVTPGDPASDEWNEETADSTTVEAWAAIKTAPGTERFQSAEQAALAPMRFSFRWRQGLVKPTSVIAYDGLFFDVKSIEERGRRKELEVIAAARAG